jgi:uncharacterized protein
MKVKSAERADWRRVLKKRFAMTQMKSREFTGYATLLCLDEVREPLWINLGGEDVRLADNGFLWMQHFPQGAHHAVTTIFDEHNDLTRWYIDVCRRHYQDTEGHIWYEDLYLDIDVSPEGKMLLLDADELDDALHQGDISGLEYELAWREVNTLMDAIGERMLPLVTSFGLCEEHRDALLKMV